MGISLSINTGSFSGTSTKPESNTTSLSVSITGIVLLEGNQRKYMPSLFCCRLLCPLWYWLLRALQPIWDCRVVPYHHLIRLHLRVWVCCCDIDIDLTSSACGARGGSVCDVWSKPLTTIYQPPQNKQTQLTEKSSASLSFILSIERW